MNRPDRILELVRACIRCAPEYGTDGIRKAQEHLYASLSKADWDQVILDDFSASDLKTQDLVVDVASLADIFRDYAHIPKLNLYAIKTFSEDGPTLILNGHIDVDTVTRHDAWTLPDGPFSAHVADGKLYGRGAADMLSGLCSLFVTADDLVRQKKTRIGRLILISVCDEEIGGNGTLRALEYLQATSLITKGAEVLIAEPTENNFSILTLGFCSFSVVVSGDPVHMGVASPNSNALTGVVDIIRKVPGIFQAAVAAAFPAIDPADVILSFGMVDGGVDPAIPCPQATLQGTFFIPPEITRDQALVVLEQVVMQCCSLPVRIEGGNFHFPGSRAGTSYLGRILGGMTSLRTFPSPCDARLFDAFGLPSVVFGPGSLRQAHSVDEWIEISQIGQHADMLTDLFEAFFTP